MPVFGLVAAGQYDRTVLKVLLEELRPDVSVQVRLCGNDSRVTTTFANQLKTLKYSNNGGHVDKAIIVRDAHCSTPERVLGDLARTFKADDYPFPVEFAAIVPELESWLLCDHQALARASAERGRSQTFDPPERPPEELRDPKAKIELLLGNAGVDYTEELTHLGAC